MNVRDGLSSNSHLLSEFSGKQLIQGEPDGSSFPSGGLRTTHKARGYTAWDYTSPVFVVCDQLGGCLHIPAVFCSIFGLSLDAKTPLLRSQRSLCKSLETALQLFGTKGKAQCAIGLEQELFLIDKELFNKRPDLVSCGRTLIGKQPPRTQQMKDHYWGSMPKRVLDCMDEIRQKMWWLGVPISTIHNEVAPAQYEIAPIYEEAGIACDHNILLMELIVQIAKKHNLEALFHEKPFSGVNGSGKHANWGLFCGDEGLLVPGETKESRRRFLFLIAAVLKGVDSHSDVLRAAVMTLGNSERLGGYEAPPAVISVFLGDLLQSLIDALRNESEDVVVEKSIVDFHLEKLPIIIQDKSDRNRTSPFAFVGNRFEFRSVGSQQNSAWPVAVLNTIVAEAITEMTNSVKNKIESGIEKIEAIESVVKEVIIEHQRIVYNEDCYEERYRTLMEERGVFEVKSMQQALECLENSNDLFINTNVLSKEELKARIVVLTELYISGILMEAHQLVDMVEGEIVPVVLEHCSIQKKQTEYINNEAAKKKVDDMLTTFEKLLESMENCKIQIEQIEATLKIEDAELIGPKMQELRKHVDYFEQFIPRNKWPFPSYEEIWNAHC
ncbi:Glutamine synthetase [Entamoeba marina]